MDAPFAKVWQAVLDEYGRVALDDTGKDIRTKVCSVVLSSLPPPWPE